MTIDYDAKKRILEVNGQRFLHVEEPAYHAFLASESKEHHFKKYISSTYIMLRDDRRCVVQGA